MDIPRTDIPRQDLPRRQSKISVDMLMSACSGAWTRFPITMVFVLYATLWGMTGILSEYTFLKNHDNVVNASWYLAAVGIPLSLAVTLWCEYLGRSIRFPMAGACMLLIADCVYIISYDSGIGEAWTIGRMALVTALAVAILFVPSRRRWTWNFTERQAIGLLISVVFSWAFGAASGIIFLTISGLFGVDDFRLMACVDVIVCAAIPTIIFLHLIPSRAEVEAIEQKYAASKFQCGTAKYFFLTLTVIYMCILYAYATKILVAWELPRGIVSWSVTGLSAAVLVTMFLLEGVRRTHPSDTLTLRALRLLPPAMLPLLVLMSVGLAYRINQYGFTAPRLYVLTFNLWCYAVFGYLSIRRTYNYNMVAISFAIVFVITSIIPYVNLTDLGNRLKHDSDNDAKDKEIIAMSDNLRLVTSSSTVDIPEGYTGVESHRIYKYNPDSMMNGSLIVGTSPVVRVPVDSLVSHNPKQLSGPLILCNNSGDNDSIFVVNSIDIQYNKTTWVKNKRVISIEIEGYLFTRQINK